MTEPHRLVVLSGPSCVGKSPLEKALARTRPDLHDTLEPLVLYNSRAPRPSETDGVDYHFRSRDDIEALRQEDNVLVMDIRGDLQALDLEDLHGQLEDTDVLFEGNPYVGTTLLEDENLGDIDRLGVFMAPLSREELTYLGQPELHVDRPALVAEVMRRKLLRRTRKQKVNLSLDDLEDIERRAGAAWREVQMAHRFGHVIVNHDGEDSGNWSDFYYPLGEARRALHAFVELLETGASDLLEQWDDLQLE